MDCLTIGARSLYRFISDEAKTNMYVLVEEKQALIVDPHLSDEALCLLRQSGITECAVLLTHEHSDHVCGIPVLQDHFKLTVICQKACAEVIASRENNQLALTIAMLSIQDNKSGTQMAASFLSKYRAFNYSADRIFESEHVHVWNQDRFVMTATPGHSPGGCCIRWNDMAVFTGDSLMVSLPVITRFPGGNTKVYKEKTLSFLHLLDTDLVALPGHGEPFRLGDALHL